MQLLELQRKGREADEEEIDIRWFGDIFWEEIQDRGITVLQ